MASPRDPITSILLNLFYSSKIKFTSLPRGVFNFGLASKGLIRKVEFFDVELNEVIDEKIVKEEIVDVFDHATVFNKNTPHVELAKELSDRGHNVLLVDYQPTSEMMVIDFAEKIKTRLPSRIKLHALKLQETDSSYAEWFASEN